MTNPELINSFTNHLKEKGKTMSTIVAYTKDVEQLSESNISKNLTSFTSSDIKHALDFLHNNKELSLKTISRKINSIRTFYKYLQDKNLVSSNPALSISHPKFKIRKPRVLTRYEYLSLREVSRSNERLYLMIETLLQTGMRISELSALKKTDIFLEEKNPFIIIRAYGSNIERKIPVNFKLGSLIKIYLLSNSNVFDPLFCTKSGKSIEVRNIRSSIDRAIIKAELKNTCVNDLRNTFIVYQLSKGMSLARLSEIVGHKNITTTSKYLDLLDKKYKPNGLDELTEL